jgi:SecD/SecF fusion protein
MDWLAAHSWVTWGIIVGLYMIACMALSNWLRDNRVWLIVGATVLGVVAMTPPGEKLKKGIDLKGGTILVYQIDTAKTPGGFTEMDKMVGALSKRINPAGTLDVTLRPMGGDRIEIIMPAADPQQVKSIQEKITQMGQLEFRILANEKHDGERGNNAIRQAREKLTKESDVNFQLGRQSYQWVRAFKPEEFIGESTPGERVALQEIKDEVYVLTLVPDEQMYVTGGELSRSDHATDEQMQPAVSFTLNSIGARKFARLTRRYKPEPDQFQYRLAIILDDRVMSAPVIRGPIPGGQGQITGGADGFKAAEVEDLVHILNSGKLPAMLIPTPLSKDAITATLGEDTIRKATQAIVVSMIVVPIFMFVYYWFCGGVANVALLLNLILILGFMGFTQTTLTLPGMAGLALTVGMAVDANVLIFERMREEQERGSSLSQSLRNGFERAWLAIFDSNLTTIITGVILWWLGTDQIKGFAVTLIFGLVANLFTAVFVTRAILEIWLRRGLLTKTTMLHLIKVPSFDYVTPRHYFMVGSGVLIAVGVTITAIRGTNLLDIDFTGGTAISVRLTDKSKNAGFVRAEAEKVLQNVRVERLIPEGASETDSLFLVRTTEQDQEAVRLAIRKKFHDELKILAVPTVAEADWQVESIPPAQEEANKDASKTKEKDAQPQPERFAGGWRINMKLNQAVNVESLSDKINAVLRAKELSDPALHYSLKPVGGATDVAASFVLETKQDPGALRQELLAALELDPIFERENNFKSQVAGETRGKAVLALVLSWVAMIIYLALRFKNVSYGLAAVVALVHDVLVALSFVALSGWLYGAVPGLASLLLIEDFKIDLTVVTAFMTIIGYSVNDTIVIFDRIREVRGKSPHVTSDMINLSINQCMSRTILTSLTVIVVLLIMFVWGGPGIHAFSFSMLIGCLSGTYSTIFIAAPILILFAGQRQGAAGSKSVSLQGVAARA